MLTNYTEQYLPNGIRLLFMPTDKFKTISMGLFLHQELNPDLAALNALLPAVMEQGSRQYPDKLTLQRKLESLYGADLNADILKSGERHVIAFGCESAHDKFLGENGALLKQGMSVLGSVTGDPLVDNGSFNKDYVNQEKIQLIKDIKAMLNDKATYAYERCIALMCAEEKFGTYKLGTIDDYANIDEEALYHYYKQVFSSNPIDLYVIGDLREQEVLEAAGEAFNFPRNVEQSRLSPTEINRPVQEVRYHEEALPVNQAKLVLGFRTYTAYGDALYCPLLVYSGILGAFPHSKLFMKVREEAGLAYYVHSRLERHKGLMIISAGINYEDYEKALEIIHRQLDDMAAGEISDTELGNTKQGLINRLRSQQDSPIQLISTHLDSSIGGKTYTAEELIAGIEAVGRPEIQAAAERIKLDTVYVLRPREGGSK